MYMRNFILFTLTFAWLTACSFSESQKTEAESQQVKVGAEVLLNKHLEQLKGHRVGLVMNPTARVNGTHMLDTLLNREVNVTALFAPEHGFRGEAGAGEVIKDGIDQKTGLPVFSLYGETKKPTPAMLEEVDILLFDMQDVGGRFYTYNVTLGLLLEAVSESNVAVWVLDRPNPAGGDYVSGWRLEEEYKSFVGAYPIPMAHGMTLGELAKMIVGEEWLQLTNKPQLKVIPAEGWKRSMKWPDTKLEWYPPSPNLPTFEHAFTYLGTVLFEGTNISEGRGTDDPFLNIGAPFLELPQDSIQQLEEEFPAISIEKASFTPQSLPGKSLNPKYVGEICYGVRIGIEEFDNIDPVKFGVRLLQVMMSGSSKAKMNDFIYKLAGTDDVTSFDTSGWLPEISSFKESRRPYLIYD